MSNPIKTHRLIVTLPDTSGEEADTIAAMLEEDLRERIRYSYADATVTHALGESLPESVAVWTVNPDHAAVTPLIFVNFDTYADDTIPRHFTAQEARELAGVLIAHAETIEAKEATS